MILDNVEMIQLPGSDELTMTVGGGSGNGSEPHQPGEAPNAAFAAYAPPASVNGDDFTIEITVADNPQPDPNDFLVGGVYALNATNRNLIRDQLQFNVTVTRTTSGFALPPFSFSTDAASLQSRIKSEVQSRTRNLTNFDSNWTAGPANTYLSYYNLGWVTRYTPSLPLAAMNNYLTTYGPMPAWNSGGGGGPGETFTLSLNDGTFVDMKDKLKVLYWGPVW